MPYDIITIGAATRDVFLRSKTWEVKPDAASPTGLEQCFPLGAKIPVDEIYFTTGGGATNAAVTFSRLGRLRVATICRIGSHDTGGQTVIADLARDHVATTFVQRDPKLHTGYSLILLAGSGERSRAMEKGSARPSDAERTGVAQGAEPLAAGGERTILVYRGASKALAATSIPWPKLRAEWFYLTSLGGDLALLRRILAYAERIGANVAWNPGSGELAKGWRTIAPLIRRCVVFNVNREEAATLTGKPTNDLAGICAELRPEPGTTDRVVLLTDGPGGAYALTADATRYIASRNLKAVNTTGAGDAFGSAFVIGLNRAPISELRSPSSIDYALRLAMANAEGVITHMGAKSGILSKMPNHSALAKYRVQEI